jgi:hypothetical protein
MLKSLLLLSCCVGLAACSGQGNFVSGVQVSSFQQSGDQYGQVNVNLSTGSLVMPSVSFPIVRSSSTIGSVALEGGVSGVSTLVLDLDVSKLVKLPVAAGNPTLPNGTALPVAGVTPSSVYTFPIGTSGSEAYISLQSGVVGVAFVIPQFTVGAVADLLLPFSFNNVTGVAGVFTGQTASKSGFALFADISSLLTSLGLSIGTSNSTVTAMEQIHAKSTTTTTTSAVEFVSQQPDSENYMQIQYMLYDLNSQSAHLQIQ